MATAGSGDGLSGCIGGLVGQGMSALDAALAGVFIHGFAGDLAKEEFGERSLLAGDIMRMLPPSILAIEKGRRG
jgi:NAD(P)H-hydrate epimerase